MFFRRRVAKTRCREYRSQGVITPPLGRFLKLDYSGMMKLPTPNDTFPDSYGRGLSNAILLGAELFLVVEFSSFESRSGGCVMTPMSTVATWKSGKRSRLLS